MPAQKLSAKEAAAELGTDARTLRKFLRSKASPIEPVGQGNRYEFTAKEVKALKKAFISWGSTSKAKAEKPAREAEPETEDVVDEMTGDLIEDLDDLEEPSDEDLDEIDIEEIEID